MPVHRHAIQKQICLAILRGGGEAAFDLHRVSTMDRALYQRMADEMVQRVIARHSSFSEYYRVSIKNPLGASLWLAGALATTAGMAAIALLQTIEWKALVASSALNGVIGLFAITAAAAGWGVSSWVAHRNTRSKHTLDIVAARFSQPAFSQALADFNAGFVGLKITEALVAEFATSHDPVKINAVRGMRYLVNFFEFISVGIIYGEFDERIIAKTLRGNIRYVYDKCAGWIGELQQRNPKTLEHFTRVRAHYEDL